MSKIEKLLKKFYTIPKDLTWEELIKILRYYGFNEISKKGISGGSRVKFIDRHQNILNFHKPHPSNIVKSYVIRQAIKNLKTWKII